MATLAGSIRHVNTHLQRLVPEKVILEAADQEQYDWRQRKLGPVQTVLLLILKILAGNASLAQLRAINHYQTCPAALQQAQKRLPIGLLQRVLKWLLSEFFHADAPRVLRIDCSNTYTADTPALRRKYRRPRQKRRTCDYPQLRSICVFDLISGLLIGEHIFSSDHQESPQLRHLLPLLRAGDVVIFDRGFVSYANFCLLRAAGVEVVARLPKTLRARRGSRRRQIKRLSKRDALVRWHKAAQRSAGFTKNQWQALPEQLDLRQTTVSCQTRGSRCRRISLITTLLDPTLHSLNQISQWYRRRWEIETDFRHLKTTLGLEMLRSKTPENIQRELLVRAIAYNLVRIVMLKAARAKAICPEQISFADACRWLFLGDADVPLDQTVDQPPAKPTIPSTQNKISRQKLSTTQPSALAAEKLK